MTAHPSVTFCARPECGRTETMHKIRTDGWSRSGTDDGVCAGFQPGQVEERVPEEVLRRRLAAVLALDVPWRPADDPGHLDWVLGYAEALDAAKRAARSGS